MLGRAPLDKLKIAITGAQGRLSPGLADYLRGNSHEVVLFSRRASGDFHPTASLADGARIRDFDVVLHLAWSSVPVLSEKTPGIEDREDLPFVSSLVRAAMQSKSLPKLVFFSTAAVYGNTGNDPATEENSCRPVGRYAMAKLRAEQIFSDYPNSCILRITNVLDGGNLTVRPQGILPAALHAARTDGEVSVWGDGCAVKDYIAASDLHRAVGAVLSRDLAGVFNVASGWSLSVEELLALVERTRGHAIRRKRAQGCSWDVKNARISSRKLQVATGWKPEVTPQAYIKSVAG